MRYFWLIGLFVSLAQDSWAFVVSDTLIIDGEIIYIEEQEEPVTDSLDQARKNDFKEKKKPLIWGVDAGFGLQITDFSISNNVRQDLVNVNEFLGVSNSSFYHSSYGVGGYFRAHKNIEIGLSFFGSNGRISDSNGSINNPSSPEGGTVSFYTSDNQIFQVFQTEVQPDVFELDTAVVSTFSQNFNLKSFQVPLKFRFYVNDFTVKSRWRAFGEISPVFRSFQMKTIGSNSSSMLFLNASGSYEYLQLSSRNWQSYGVLVGVGSEFKLTKRLNAFVQANWSFPPINHIGDSGVSYYSQYSNLFLGFRILMSNGK
jgi:hypothetical protein